MTTSKTAPGPVAAGAIVILTLALMLAACGGDEGEATTTQAPTSTVGTTTTESPTTTTAEPGAVPDLELLGGLLQALLTTDEIGGGWIDQGRVIVPPGSNQRTGFLCPEGQAIADPLGSAFDPQVATSFRLESAAGNLVGETLLAGPQGQVVQDYATWIAALEACANRGPWESEAGTLRIDRLEVPALGNQVFAYYAGPAAEVAGPWFEWRSLDILLVDENSEFAAVLLIQVTAVHDPPDQPVTPVADEEWIRIAEAAIAKITEGA